MRKVSGEWHNVDVGIIIITSTSINLNEFIENIDKRVSNVTIEDVSGACVIIGMCCDINETNFVIKNISIEGTFKDRWKEGWS